MIRRLLISIAVIISSFSAFSQLQVGDWKLYSVFSGLHIQNIIDTGDIVYYLSDGYLFSYDKENDETTYYNKRNDMSDVNIDDIYYNYDKNYLFIAYVNSNIDLLYDDGNVVNMPDLKNTVLTGDKSINSVDFQDDEIYVATDFGYMVLDDEKHIIKESFKYGKVFNSMIATDKYIYAVFDSNIWVSPKDGNHFYISSFEKTNRNFNTKLVKLSDTKMVCGSGWCYLMTIGNDKNITDIPFSSIRGAEVSLVSSEATYLLWIDFRRITEKDVELKDFLRRETGLYLCEGSEYGKAGEGFLRMNAACPRERLKDGLMRLKRGIEAFVRLPGRRGRISLRQKNREQVLPVSLLTLPAPEDNALLRCCRRGRAGEILFRSPVRLYICFLRFRGGSVLYLPGTGCGSSSV